jgi:K+-transporting ATPase ATPase A chain
MDKDGKPLLDEKGQPKTNKATLTEQVIAVGPAASQIAIKQFGTNGGGFFNANSAHPFENPTGLTNWLELVAILAAPFALTWTFGRYTGNQRQGWTLFAAMAAVLIVGAVVAMHTEASPNPLFPSGVDQALGSMEGKETRFGAAVGGLFAAATTGTSTGAINAWHDSLQPLGGLVPLFNMELGEITPGGIGAGLYGMLVIGAILAVFIAGLMVGRTPEYVGKRIEQKEVKMAMLALIATAFSILVFTSISSVAPFAKGGYWNSFGPATGNLNNAGPHGFAEILYAYSSATGNNGSAFAGISANTPWYNLTLGVAMMIGRFLFLLPLLAAAGSLALKKGVPVTSGTLPTHGGLFVGLLIGTVIIVGALTFFPALALGPIVEHFLMGQGHLFSLASPMMTVMAWQ